MKVGRYDIQIKELSYWDNEEIKGILASGAKFEGTGSLAGVKGSAMLESKLKTLQCSITEIKEGEKVISFSEDWVKQLTLEEGQLIESEINRLSKKK